MTPALLCVVGASGAGKTAAVDALEARRLTGVTCHHFDSIGVPSPDAMVREWGSGERWQEEMTKRWLARLATSAGGAEIAVLEGQTRPSFIQAHVPSSGLRHRILLLDCSAAVRQRRLCGPRAQPELSNPQMDSWAAYLRGQADALRLRVIDTSDCSVAQVADILQKEVEALRAAV